MVCLTLEFWAQFHKSLLNIEDSMLLKLDLNRPLVKPLQKCSTELILGTYQVPETAGLLVRKAYQLPQ